MHDRQPQVHSQGLVRDTGDSQAVVGSSPVEHGAVNVEGMEL